MTIDGTNGRNEASVCQNVQTQRVATIPWQILHQGLASFVPDGVFGYLQLLCFFRYAAPFLSFLDSPFRSSHCGEAAKVHFFFPVFLFSHFRSCFSFPLTIPKRFSSSSVSPFDSPHPSFRLCWNPRHPFLCTSQQPRHFFFRIFNNKLEKKDQNS